jgi:aspartate kinase
MARLVMKFGGTSVADLDRIRHACAHIEREVKAGHEVAVVVSAMAGQTNTLVDLCRKASPLHDAREYDAVVSSGEQVTSGVMAIVLQSMGLDARSWQGWQIPISTSGAHSMARIKEIEADELDKRLSSGQIAVVAGFQGLGPDNRIATLGRGGSDTSAVALAAALKADRCDIYTDVDGVYTTDPRIVPKARKMQKIAFEEMLEMASLGAKVLQVRSVEMAMVHHVPVRVLSSFASAEAIDDASGTIICDEDEIMEQEVVTGIAYSKDEAQISLRRVPDRPGVAAAVFTPLAEAGINVDMIVQNISEDGQSTDMTFSVPDGDYDKAMKTLNEHRDKIGFHHIDGSRDVVKISVIGIGMRSHAGVAARAFEALSAKSINIRAISTSEIKLSVLIDSAYTELAVRTLHSLYGLDAAPAEAASS